MPDNNGQQEAATVTADEKSVDEARQEFVEQLEQTYAATEGVRREGNEIIIPEWMDFKDAADTLLEHQEQMEETRREIYDFECHPNDGLVCLNRAIEEEFGRVMGEGRISFFGKEPPSTKAIPVGVNETKTVPIDKISIPGTEVTLEVGGGEDKFSFRATYPRKFEPLVERIADLTRQKLHENSIFQGKAITSDFSFIDVSHLEEDKIVFPEETETQLDANIFTPIESREQCKAADIPIKRGVLMHGPFGTGKTLTALHAAKKCVENEWTFIQVETGDDIVEALEYAQRYQPCTVFVEDIDVATESERNQSLNRILNKFDGMMSKEAEVMVIVTTNRIDAINRGMLRPGRLDAVIKLDEWEGEEIVEFVRKHAQTEEGVSLIEDELDEQAIIEAAEGFVPAFLAEGVSRAKVYAMRRNGDDEPRLRTEDLVEAFEGLRPQYELMQQEAEIREDSLDDRIGDLVGQQVDETVQEMVVTSETGFEGSIERAEEQ